MSAAPWHVDTEDPLPTDYGARFEASVLLASVAWPLVLLALSAMTSCSLNVRTPEHVDLRYPCPYRASAIALVGATLEDEWAIELGEDVAGLTDDVRVQCVPGLWSVEGVDGWVSGQTLGPDTVRVAYRGGDMEGVWPLRRTALGHELIHVALWRRDGYPDDAHESEAWELERETRLRLYSHDVNGCPLAK